MNRNVPRRGRAHPYLTRKEAAKYLGLAINTLAHHPKRIPYYKICSRVLYLKKELDRLIHPHPKGESFTNVSPSKRKNVHSFLSRKEAAEYLRLSVDTLAHYPEEIPFHKFCNRAFYIKEELDDIVHSSRRGGES
jgi:hypothetical protein